MRWIAAWLLTGLAVPSVWAETAPAAASDEAELARLGDQFSDLYNAGRYREAIAVVECALAIRKRQVGDAHPDIGNLLVNLGELHRLAGDLKDVEPYFVQALAILEKALGPQHPQVATVLNNLGALRLQLGDPKGAEAYLRRALAVMEASLGADHPDVAQARLNLGQVRTMLGDLDGAEALDRQALAALEKARGPEHPQTAVALNNLAAVLLARADFAAALPMLERVLAIFERSLGTQHPQVATAQNNLAEAWAARGDLGKAQPLYERAVALLTARLGEKHPDLAQVYANLARLQTARGDRGRAKALHERALAIREAALGGQHPAVAESCNDLGLLALYAGEAKQATPLLERALGIRKGVLGPAHALVAQSENNLAGAYRQTGRGKEAAELYGQALAHWRTALGPDHPDLANALNNLGLLHHEQGDYAAARTDHQNALKLREARLGPQHPLVAASLANLAGAEQALGHNPAAVQGLTRALAIREGELRRAVATGTSEQRALAVLAHASDIHRAVSLHLRDLPNDPQALRLALTVVLQRKARGLDAAVDGNELLRRHLQPQDQALLQRLQEVTARIAALFQQGPGKLGEAEYQKLLAQLHTQADGLEQQLARKAPALVDAGEVSIEKVQAALPADARLLELVAYWPMDVKAKAGQDPLQSRRYAAYVLGKTGAPRALDLGEAEPIDLLAKQLREALAVPGRAEGLELARQLDAKLLEPLQPLLGTGTTVLVSPDGPLHLLPFGALRSPDGRFRVEQNLFVMVASGREVLRLREPGKAGAPAVVVAAPEFGPAGASGFAALPGTAQEASALAKLLPKAKVLTGAQASEAALRELHGPEILHLATHGFFTPERPLAGVPAAAGRASRGAALLLEPEVVPVATDLPDPFLRSGLALAGANTAGERGDGLLTAAEAELLDLRGTKLVVLSACETGIGAVAGAEGVVGLRRALVLAGAEALVMSLWKVDDEATRDLMISYYQGLTAGQGRAEALRAAQRKLLASPGRSHPFYWAAFIASGDWRGLGVRY